MVGGFLYSEFVIGSSRFLYPIKITETPLSKIQERTGRSENPFFYLTEILKKLIFGTFALPLLVFYLMTVFTLSWATSVWLFQSFLLMQLFSVLFSRFSFLFLR
jgi:hypothetical protein